MRVNPNDFAPFNSFYFYKWLLDLFGKSYSKAYSIGNFSVERLNPSSDEEFFFYFTKIPELIDERIKL